MDLLSIVNQMLADGTVARVTRNPIAQFGPATRRYIGAELLPEQTTTENSYQEDMIRYKTIIANDGSRYSPAQRKTTGAIIGSFLVILGNQDIKGEFTGRDYDGFVRLLNARPTYDSILQITGWLDTTINRALIELSEKHRWDAIVSASVVRKGDNGYQETVTIPNPAGHRVNAGGTWSSNVYDPYPDLVAGAQKLWDKGYTVGRMVTSRKVIGILSRNTNMINRTTGRLFTKTDGSIGMVGLGQTNLDSINALLSADGLPGLETYDLQYNTQTGSARFMPDNVVCMFAMTGRDQAVVEQTQGTVLEVIPDTLGYQAVGRAVGQGDPGRIIHMWPFDNKPPRVVAEGWQTSFPVITEPEALFVIGNIS
jgi:hypothetical protein